MPGYLRYIFALGWPTTEDSKRAHVLHPLGMHLENGGVTNGSVTVIHTIGLVSEKKILTRNEGCETQEAKEGKEIVPPPLSLANKAEHN